MRPENPGRAGRRVARRVARRSARRSARHFVRRSARRLPRLVPRLAAAAMFAVTPALAQEQGGQEKAKTVKPARAARAIRLVPTGRAPAPTKEQLKERYAQKLAQPFASRVAWTTDFDDARAKAKATGRRIFVYFTRSYAP